MTTGTKHRYTETLSQLRLKEVTSRQPGQLVLRVTSEAERKDVRIRGRRFTVGAHGDNDLVLDDPAVSDLHCEMTVDDDGSGLLLRDLGSKNGTWIGANASIGVREVWVGLGGSFSIGTFEITLLDVEAVTVPVSTLGRFDNLYGRGTKMGELFAKLERLATFDLDVLIVGETGTGKELVAQGLHARSGRKGEFVVLNCADVDDGLIGSQLHGHIKGAFTGAENQVGLLEQADGGTLFLDEIGDLSLSLQQKLLRILAQREFQPRGAVKPRAFDARVVAATNRDLTRMVGAGEFREDLYFRFAQMTLELPSLRDRGSVDIHALADLFLDRIAKRRGTQLRLSRGAYDVLEQCRWRGNVRELHNAISYAASWAQGEEVTEQDLPTLELVGMGELASTAVGRAPAGRASAHSTELEGALLLPLTEARIAFERVYVARVLADASGNKSEAARRLGVSRSTFGSMLKRVGLS
ncbi:MAG: sigma 54-dependent Fis family transcriptional regulator [Nannocystaceae bacterium]|nr:sigma 54-dependent Fis family transcriptional regulator [Nannocystaceae bacterium]